ncbi:MAG: phage head closure protein [Acidobacteriales bacterium]|nr:phage head closure protein [Terriglobales bacterium]
MRAGTLRQRISIEQPAETQNDFNEPVVTWSLYATRWAEVVPLSGEERLIAQQVNAEVTHRVRLRYLAGVTTKMRIVHKGRVLDINTILNQDERRAMLELLCKEAT